MVFEIKGGENIGIIDTHGVLKIPKPGQSTHYSRRPTTESFLKNLETYLIKLRRTQIELQPPTYLDQIRGLRDGLGTFYKPIGVEPSLLSRWERWDFLTADSFVGHEQYSLKWQTEGAEEYRPEYDEHFDPYVTSGISLEGLRELHDAGLNLVVCSGIPYEARFRFRKELALAAPFLHPQYAVLLNPDTENLPGTNVKLISIGVLGNPEIAGEENVNVVPAKNVYIWDDDIVTALWIVHFYDLFVHLIVNKSRALNQPHFKNSLLPPNYVDLFEKIIWGSTGERILQDVKDSNFINRPKIRSLYQ